MSAKENGEFLSLGEIEKGKKEGGKSITEEEQKASLLGHLYVVMLRLKGGGVDEERLAKFEEELEKLKDSNEANKDERVKRFEELLKKWRSQLIKKREEIETGGREIAVALLSGDKDKEIWAIKKLEELVAEVGEEKVAEVMGDEWVGKLKNGEWKEFEIKRVVPKARKAEEKAIEADKKVANKLKEVDREIEQQARDDIGVMVRELKEEVEAVGFLREEEIKKLEGSGGKYKFSEQLALLIEGDGEDGAAAWEKLLADLDKLPMSEARKRIMRMMRYLEVMEDNLNEWVVEGVEYGDLDGSVEVELWGLPVVFEGSGETRLQSLFKIIEGRSGEELESLDGERVLGKLLELNNEEAKKEWEVIKKRVGESARPRKVIERQRLNLVAKRESLAGRGRSVEVPIDRMTGRELPIEIERWQRMSDEERDSFLEWWSGLAAEEKNNFYLAREAMKKMGINDEREVGREGALGAFSRRAGVEMENESYRKMSAEVGRLSEEEKERKAKELMRQIMNTGETSRSDANRELSWYLSALLGQMENAELRNLISVKLLWYDVQLSVPGIGTSEDLARMAKWVWYEAYDDLLDMKIDLGTLGLEDKQIQVRELIAELESLPDGSADVWLGRILGAKTPQKAELAQRQLLLAISMKKKGFDYYFDENDKLRFGGEGADEFLGSLEVKLGLQGSGNELVESLPKTGLRGEEDMFGLGEFKWLVGAAISFEHLTLRSPALEAGRNWRLLPNDIRKLHGYSQKFYMEKVAPDFPSYAEVFDLQFRSLIGWKFGYLLNVFEEKLENGGLEAGKRKKFMEFLKELSLTDEVSAEARRSEDMKRLLSDGGFTRKMKRKLGEDFDWKVVLGAMGVEAVGDLSWEEGWNMFAEQYSWIKVINFTSLRHTDAADFWKYALAAREAFGSLDIPLGDSVTPGLISQGVIAITGKLGLGKRVGRAWGRRASSIYLEQSGGGLRISRRIYEKSDGTRGLEQWRWKNSNGEELERERERAVKMGYRLGKDGYVYDHLGRRVFRQRNKLIGRTEFDEWGMSGLDFNHRMRIIDKWNRDRVLTKKQKNLMKTQLRIALWLGIEIETPQSYLEIPGLIVKRLLQNPLTLLGLPWYVLRGFYNDILMNDWADEGMEAMKPLLGWLGQAVENA